MDIVCEDSCASEGENHTCCCKGNRKLKKKIGANPHDLQMKAETTRQSLRAGMYHLPYLCDP